MEEIERRGGAPLDLGDMVGESVIVGVSWLAPGRQLLFLSTPNPR